MKNSRSSIALLLAFSAVSAFPLASAQAQTTLSSTLKLSFWGVNVGKMNSSVQIDQNNYSVKGAIKTAGLGKVVGKASAFVSSYGSIQGVRLVPAAHALSFNTRKKKGSLKLNFAAGNVSSSVSTPKVKYKEGSIAVQKSHLNAVLDPLSSKGFEGNVFTCALRYQPISGIRPFKQNIKFMKANRDMEITVAQVGNTNIYTLFGFKVKTQKGTAKGYATKFKTN